MKPLLAVVLVCLMGCAPAPPSAPPPADIVPVVRAAIAAGEWTAAESIVRERLADDQMDAAAIAALSWIGRGALADGQLNLALGTGREAEQLAEAALVGRSLAAEPDLETALGAGLEVQAQVLAAQGRRSDAVQLLQRALDRYRDSVVHARIQKNIHLLSLTGAPAPGLDTTELLTATPAPASLEGQPTLLFFWAHWCSDCKAQGPSLERLRAEFGDGLRFVAPTQRYGYAADASIDAAPAEERDHIAEVFRASYGFLAGAPVPLSEANFRSVGVSSTPTLVLVDAAGLVRLYRPGMMPETELRAAILDVLSPAGTG